MHVMYHVYVILLACSMCLHNCLASVESAKTQTTDVDACPKSPGNSGTNEDGYYSQEDVDRMMNKLDTKNDQVRDTETYISQHGVANIRKYISDKLQEYIAQPIHIGVTGQSGTGKSSLINTIRSLKPNAPGAAKVGTTQTTMKIAPYPHPELDNVVLWDLPGVNTPDFPQRSYVGAVKLDLYDALIICSASRFLESDMWLAKQAHSKNITVYYVRTKIDLDIHNAMRDDPDAEEDQIVQNIRREIEMQAKQNLPAIANNIFIISTVLEYKTLWDYRRLMDQLLENAPKKNQVALIMALVACSETFVKRKREELEKRIPQVAIKAGKNVGQHQAIVKKEITTYMKWFGLSEEVKRNFLVEFKRLEEKLMYISHWLEDIESERPEEHTQGRDKGIWLFFIKFIEFIKFLFGKMFYDTVNRHQQQQWRAKYYRALSRADNRRQEVTQSWAEITLMDALKCYTKLAEDSLETIKQTSTFM